MTTNLDRVREFLNRDKIKLWLPPYTKQDTEENLKDLATRISSQFQISEEEALHDLKALQQKSLDNLREREEFKSTGLACIKVQPTQRGKSAITLKMLLSNSGKALKEKISESLEESPSRVKLIFKGKVLKDDEMLVQQGMTHGAQVMCLLMSTDVKELNEFEEHNKSLDETKRDVELISRRKNSGGQAYLQVADQTGKLLNIPKKEREALVMAMTLHEKGRAALKKGNFEQALVLLLEAEKEFVQCNSSLLDQVDNYGLLSLDVAWCYLHLKSLSQLPDAEIRLQRCEASFVKSYGPNLERLVTLKGSAGNERVLFLRLHLLRAIVLYHHGKTSEARALMNKVGTELQILKVDDSKLSHLVELGYSVGESRLALRESRGDSDLAVSVIENKRAERRNVMKEEKVADEMNKQRKKLGKCKNGSWVEPEFHKALVNMGYSQFTAKWALAETNNRISDAVALIQEHPDRIPVTDTAVGQLVSLGFDEDKVIETLERSCGAYDKALRELSNQRASSANPSTSSTIAKDEQDAFERVREGLDSYEENHLDLELLAEEEFYKEYKVLIDQNQ